MSSFIRHQNVPPSLSAGKTVKTGKGGFTVISSGCPSLDAVLMDGIPLGTVLTVQEDWPKSSVNFSSLLVKSFIAESVCQQERCLVISKDAPFVDAIPDRVEDASSSQANVSQSDEQFKIAWRYKHLQHGMEIQPTKPSRIFFDFGKRMSEHNVNKCVTFTDTLPVDLQGYTRIVICGFGSPMFDDSVFSILPLIRQVKERSAVMLITTPSYCVDNNSIITLNHLSDCVINLDSVRSRLANCDCFLTVVKPFTMIRQYLPDILSMCIKLDKRRLVVEPFHLPPDIDDAGVSAKTTAGGCASSANKGLDF